MQSTAMPTVHLFSVESQHPWKVLSSSGLLRIFIPGDGLEIKHLGFRSEIDEMGASIQDHVWKKLWLVHLTSVGTGDSDPYWDFIVHKVGKIVLRTVAGLGLGSEIPGWICPKNPIVNEKEVHLMFLGMRDLGQLKTPGRRVDIALAQYKQKITHTDPPFASRTESLITYPKRPFKGVTPQII
jgi:hypothetical protein